jgi:hypothetical protein
VEGLEKVELPEDTTQRLRVGAGVVALAWCAMYGWFSFVQSTDVPLLWLMQLAVHETGHRVFAPFGEYTMILMGSGSEILFPLLLGGHVLSGRGRGLPAHGDVHGRCATWGDDADRG